jgi:hypothetical protein
MAVGWLDNQAPWTVKESNVVKLYKSVWSLFQKLWTLKGSGRAKHCSRISVSALPDACAIEHFDWNYYYVALSP